MGICAAVLARNGSDFPQQRADRRDLEELRIKAKPKTRAELKAEATKPLAAE
ncbi:hypothetical protein M2175_003160 [Bradyrhizobium elkanii]|nr:hypothetical protein [Bradyrhizobium elkanii]MCS3968683.1 hypothetical protein [Bradyrhizobium japonicum]